MRSDRFLVFTSIIIIFSLTAAEAQAPSSSGQWDIEPAKAQPVDNTQVIPTVSTDELTLRQKSEENDIADRLNSLQQLEQMVTFTRTIDGEIVETVTEKITYAKDDPIQSTEAGTSIIDRLNERFDRAALTRNEAFEEAKLDFIVADIDRSGSMSADEFVALVAHWRADENSASGADDLRQVSIDENGEITATGGTPITSAARKKFAFMTGMNQTIAKSDYIREYLTEFDAFDENNDSYLRGEELEGFRKANRGESL